MRLIMFDEMIKVYEPAPRVSYIIYFSNKKGRTQLYSACGNIDMIKEYCDKHKIDYSKCKDNTVEGCHYFEEIKIWEKV